MNDLLGDGGVVVDAGSAEGTGGVGVEPGVDAGGMEGVAAAGEEPQGFAFIELAQTHRAVSPAAALRPLLELVHCRLADVVAVIVVSRRGAVVFAGSATVLGEEGVVGEEDEGGGQDSDDGDDDRSEVRRVGVRVVGDRRRRREH